MRDRWRANAREEKDEALRNAAVLVDCDEAEAPNDVEEDDQTDDEDDESYADSESESEEEPPRDGEDEGEQEDEDESEVEGEEEEAAAVAEAREELKGLFPHSLEEILWELPTDGDEDEGVQLDVKGIFGAYDHSECSAIAKARPHSLRPKVHEYVPLVMQHLARYLRDDGDQPECSALRSDMAVACLTRLLEGARVYDYREVRTIAQSLHATRLQFRTKQTARKSTGGRAPRSEHEESRTYAEAISLIMQAYPLHEELQSLGCEVLRVILEQNGLCPNCADMDYRCCVSECSCSNKLANDFGHYSGGYACDGDYARWAWQIYRNAALKGNSIQAMTQALKLPGAVSQALLGLSVIMEDLPQLQDAHLVEAMEAHSADAEVQTACLESMALNDSYFEATEGGSSSDAPRLRMDLVLKAVETHPSHARLQSAAAIVLAKAFENKAFEDHQSLCVKLVHTVLACCMSQPDPKVLTNLCTALQCSEEDPEDNGFGPKLLMRLPGSLLIAQKVAQATCALYDWKGASEPSPEVLQAIRKSTSLLLELKDKGEEDEAVGKAMCGEEPFARQLAISYRYLPQPLPEHSFFMDSARKFKLAILEICKSQPRFIEVASIHVNVDKLQKATERSTEDMEFLNMDEDDYNEHRDSWADDIMSGHEWCIVESLTGEEVYQHAGSW